MTIDQQQVRRLAPLAVPVVIIAAAWFVLIRPAAADSARAARELDNHRQRLEAVRAIMREPPPPVVSADPMQAFERQVAPGDASGQIVKELLALAGAAGISQPSIQTGERGQVAAATAPRVADGPQPDPRFQLFAVPLIYTTVTLAFDTDYASLGRFLWGLRDLATIIELRALEVSRVEAAATEVDAPPSQHVRAVVSLFAYARVAETPRATTGEGAPR